MDLSVITVTWNSEKLIREQVSSVFAGCVINTCEEIVVDNGSKDGTIAIVGAYCNTPQPVDQSFAVGANGRSPQQLRLRLVANKTNAGFSAANNQGAKMATGDFLLFLNPDMRVAPGSLDTMLDWIRARPSVGLASCKLLDEKGNLNADALPRRWPGLLDQIAIILKLPHLFPGILDRYLWKGFNADVEQEVDSVRGSFMIMRREVYEKLGWAYDPRYFIWFEDVDLCREVHRLGYKVVHTPVISCVDYIGQSFNQRTSLWKQKEFTRSMLTYFKKWEPWYVWMWIALFRPVGIFMAWVYETLSTKKI